MMNILVLSDGFWPDQTGGISKSLLPEVKGLVARGHTVVVVTRRLKKALPLHDLREGYELYRYPSPSKGTILYRLYPLFSLTQLPELVGQLHRKFRFHVAYIVNNPFQALGFSRSLLKIPYVYVFYAPTSQEIELDAAQGRYGWSTPLVKAVNYWIKTEDRQALSKATRVIVRSEFSRKEMQRFYGEVKGNKTVHFPLCVDTDRFSFAEDPRAVRKELGLPLESRILFTVRRLVARMGFESLIAAMSYVVKEVPDVLLFIGGKGFLENSLRAQVRKLHLESTVEFLGFVSEENLPKYYQAADLFVLPTMALEGFGLVTIEALSCGTPVVATPIGANPEVLGPLGKQFLCQDRTPEALAERIIWFLNRGFNTELRRHCRDYCVSNFNVEKVVSSIEEVLKSASQR
jgi:glycosyltransferase involved in cell wall biosynthesis